MRFIFIFLFIMSSVGAFAQSVYFEGLSLAGVDASKGDVLTELIKDGLEAQRGVHLTTNKADAELILTGKVIGLDGAFIISLIVKTKSGDTKVSERMKAMSANEFDMISKRLVEAVFSGKSLDSNPKYTEVTEVEQTKGQRRYEAKKQVMLTFGPAILNKDFFGPDSEGMMFGGGYMWGIDPSFDMGIMGSMIFDEKLDNGATANVLVNFRYYLNENKHAPFATVGIGRTVATDFNNHDAKEWGLHLGYGHKFFRTSTVNLGLGIQVYF